MTAEYVEVNDTVFVTGLIWQKLDVKDSDKTIRGQVKEQGESLGDRAAILKKPLPQAGYCESSDLRQDEPNPYPLAGYLAQVIGNVNIDNWIGIFPMADVEGWETRDEPMYYTVAIDDNIVGPSDYDDRIVTESQAKDWLDRKLSMGGVTWKEIYAPADWNVAANRHKVVDGLASFLRKHDEEDMPPRVRPYVFEFDATLLKMVALIVFVLALPVAGWYGYGYLTDDGRQGIDRSVVESSSDDQADEPSGTDSADTSSEDGPPSGEGDDAPPSGEGSQATGGGGGATGGSGGGAAGGGGSVTGTVPTGSDTGETPNGTRPTTEPREADPVKGNWEDLPPVRWVITTCGKRVFATEPTVESWKFMRATCSLNVAKKQIELKRHYRNVLNADVVSFINAVDNESNSVSIDGDNGKAATVVVPIDFPDDVGRYPAVGNRGRWMFRDRLSRTGYTIRLSQSGEGSVDVPEQPKSLEETDREDVLNDESDGSDNGKSDNGKGESSSRFGWFFSSSDDKAKPRPDRGTSMKKLRTIPYSTYQWGIDLNNRPNVLENALDFPGVRVDAITFNPSNDPVWSVTGRLYVLDEPVSDEGESP